MLIKVRQDNPAGSAIVGRGLVVIPPGNSPLHPYVSQQTKTQTFAHMLDLFYNISTPGAPLDFFYEICF